MGDPDGPGAGEELLAQPAPSRGRRLGYALGAAVLVAAVLTAVLTRHRGPHPNAAPDPAPTGSSAPAPPPSQLPAPSERTDPVILHPSAPLPDVGKVQLFARAANAVVQVNFAAGWIREAPLPGLLSTGPVSFGATSGGAYVRPLDAVPGYFVPDNGPARKLTGALANQSGLPGPDPDSMWIEQDGPQTITGFRLAALPGGTATPVRLRIPAAIGQMRAPQYADGSGYVLAWGTGGTFDLRPDGAHRLPIDLGRSPLLATGSDRLLVTSCPSPALQRCPISLVRLPDGRATRVGTVPAVSGLPVGVISGDHSTALIYQPAAPGQLSARLLDLRTGHFRGPAIGLDAEVEPGSAVYSADSRWAFLVGRGGSLVAVDARTGSARSLSLGLPILYQLSVRR